MITFAQATSPKLLMGHAAPSLVVQTLDNGLWRLADQTPEHYTMVVFYRGLHCPVCQQYLTELDQKLVAFAQLGVQVIALSGDGIDKTQQLKAQANLQQLSLGYGLTPEQMRDWGLYLSQGHFEQEPALFSEPAVFLIQPDGRLYFANIGTHPFSRIDFDSLLAGLAYVIPNHYPLRGTE